MDKKLYLATLNKELRHLPKADREKAMEYYEEFFADAGEENEQHVIEELGTPADVAGEIIRDLAIKTFHEPNESVKKGVSSIWIIILAIFAAPMALPMLIVLLALIFCIFLPFIVCVLVVGIIGITLIASSFICIVAGIYLLFSQFLNALTILGVALIMIGVGVLFIYVFIMLVKGFLFIIGKLFKKILKGGKKNETTAQ